MRFVLKETENGLEFVNSNNNKYLVTYEVEGEISVVIETATEIFSKMEMSDCYDIHILGIVWLREYDNAQDFRIYGYPTCVFEGTWCCRNPKTGKIDPPRMQISKITGDCEILDVGYATEH